MCGGCNTQSWPCAVEHALHTHTNTLFWMNHMPGSTKPSSSYYLCTSRWMLNHFNCSRSHKMAVSKKTPPLLPNCLPPSPQLTPSPLQPLFSLLFSLLPLSLSLPVSLTHSFCVLCQKVLQCWYSVKSACQQLDLSLDPVHPHHPPRSCFGPRYPAQKGNTPNRFLTLKFKGGMGISIPNWGF